MKIFITGAAGFIGAALAKRLLDEGHEIFGIDNFDPYYDVALKKARLAQLENKPRFRFKPIDLADLEALQNEFRSFRPDKVCHLAAQAGVRFSIENPHAYQKSNLLGFLNILESCRHNQSPHLVFASTSSIYGLNTRLPYSEHNSTEHPASLYAATKKSNEMMAHAYSSLYGLPATGLRFFTVYGPWGRPDMSYFLFTKKILAGEPIQIFNKGEHKRDFTFIEDIVGGIQAVLEAPAPQAQPDWNSLLPDPATSSAPFRLYNIGRGEAVDLSLFIETLEKALGRTALKEYLPMQAGDVKATWADVSALKKDFGYAPRVSVEEGIQKFVSWYRDYYRA